MRQIIERVSCDRCGQIHDFERLNNGPARMVARIESLTEWLERLGWTSQKPEGSSQFRVLDFCPVCKKDYKA